MVDPLDLGWNGEINISNFTSVLSDPLMNVCIGIFGSFIIVLFFMRFMNSIPIMKGMVLTEGAELTSDEKHKNSLLGKDGKTLTDLKPSGSAMIDGERVDVVSDGEFIPKECNVVVLKHEGLRVLVERSD